MDTNRYGSEGRIIAIYLLFEALTARILLSFDGFGLRAPHLMPYSRR